MHCGTCQSRVYAKILLIGKRQDLHYCFGRSHGARDAKLQANEGLGQSGMQAQVPHLQSCVATRQYVLACAPCTVMIRVDNSSPVQFFDKTENSASNAHCFGDQMT
jgi:hypothetical protein